MSQETTNTPQAPVRKQQQRSLVTQQKLLEAAIEAFSENGFKGTSTRDIAERAGVHHPLITYHFKNKDLLWRAAAQRVFSDFTQSLAKLVDDNRAMDPKSRMAAMIRAHVYYAKSQPAMYKVLVQESSYPNPRLDWLIEEHLKPYFETTFSMIKQLQDLGVAPKGNPALLFNMIRLTSGGLLAISNELRGSSGIDFESTEALDELVDLVVRVFLPGDMPTTTPPSH